MSTPIAVLLWMVVIAAGIVLTAVFVFLGLSIYTVSSAMRKQRELDGAADDALISTFKRASKSEEFEDRYCPSDEHSGGHVFITESCIRLGHVRRCPEQWCTRIAHHDGKHKSANGAAWRDEATSNRIKKITDTIK